MPQRTIIIPGRESDPQNYYWYKNAFSSEKLEKLEKLIADLPFKDADTFGGKTEMRRSKIKWLYQTSDFDWLYDDMLKLASEANDKLWNFNLVSSLEAIQYTEYHSDDLGHYDWHQDIGPGNASKRKVSITIQLSDSEDYIGGDLQIWKGGNDIQNCPRGAGVGVIFPSYMMHRVTEVTKGVRKSLVLWLGGQHYT